MSQIMAPFQLLELNVISAQDLAPVGRNMRTYAVAWVHPDRKLSTRVDTQGHTGPTWNDKFVFRVDEEFLYSDESAIMIEIYALHWFRDIHVGTVRVLVGNLIPPPSRPFQSNRPPLGMRFVALQVRRPSGRPQGILNVGVAVLDSSMRSMPLYTHNASAVGYRHLMGEKDAYDTHNHLSPHVFHHQAPRPELRRTKSDTSSIIASEAMARQQRAFVNKGKANSIISGSEVSVKKKKKKGKKKSKSPSSVLSGVSAKSGKATRSVLSDTALPWKVKNRKNSSAPAVDNVQVEPLPPPVHNVVVEGDDAHSIVNSVSEAATTEINANATQEHVPVNNVAYEVSASPRPHYRNSPAPAQFRNSPAPQFKNSPAPQYMNSPAAHYKNSPAAHYKNSPAPHYKNSPAPHYKHSPAQQYMNSPAPQYMNSPKPQFVNSPKPHYVNSPKPQFMNSPKPQFVNSPMQQFRNSPAVVPPQFRNSPAVSKFNPAVGYGGSHKGTPMHQFGKFEYATPRRSNLGNMGLVVMTESELGPSPSEVAAEMARKPVIDEGENSTVGGWSLDESVEGLQSKLERWRTELPPVIDRGELSSHPTSSTKTSRHSRRHTDGGNGLFSCFSNICGLQCTIVCGGDPKGKKNRGRRSPSAEIASSM
ncbi:uncharacterized protein LOC113873189 [Abrus precatorius]|uniref:Uncharacterized protein LOC113873189 n=1 Tax=Abrus precatorius TaxID=3816 RepID=A0A8B8ME93_ABRPR|nr:uncharacterized protein LOC113873189 [Abrus precatorius]